MAAGHEARSLRVRGFLALACSVALLSGATAAHAEPVAGGPKAHPLVDQLLGPLERFLVPRCLTPAVDQIFNDLVTTGAFQAVLRDSFTLERVDARDDHIELDIQDGAHHPYGITLSLRSKGGTADGQGRQFLFYLMASPNPPNPHAKTALLAIASLLDEAIPETALTRCSGEAHGAGGQPGIEQRYPRTLALASAAVEVVVLVAAILFGLRAVRSRGGPIDGDV